MNFKEYHIKEQTDIVIKSKYKTTLPAKNPNLYTIKPQVWGKYKEDEYYFFKAWATFQTRNKHVYIKNYPDISFDMSFNDVAWIEFIALFPVENGIVDTNPENIKIEFLNNKKFMYEKSKSDTLQVFIKNQSKDYKSIEELDKIRSSKYSLSDFPNAKKILLATSWFDTKEAIKDILSKQIFIRNFSQDDKPGVDRLNESYTDDITRNENGFMSLNSVSWTNKEKTELQMRGVVSYKPKQPQQKDGLTFDFKTKVMVAFSAFISPGKLDPNWKLNPREFSKMPEIKKISLYEGVRVAWGQPEEMSSQVTVKYNDGQQEESATYKMFTMLKPNQAKILKLASDWYTSKLVLPDLINIFIKRHPSMFVPIS